MLRGFYTAASGMISQQRQQEMISNNLANVHTPGYKAEQSGFRSFPELLLHQLGSKNIPTTNGLKVHENNPIGSINTGVYVQEYIPNFEQGAIRQTGLETDLAIVNGEMPDEAGSIFFTVQNENGDIRYTRNGNFTVDGEGYVTTNDGYNVMDQNQNRIFTDGLAFTVTEEGIVQTDNADIPLGLAYIANPNDLVKQENDLYNAAPNAIVSNPLDVGATYSIRQTFLESSNVDPMQSMTSMIKAYRNFELNQRVMKAFDESMGKAVNEIGRLG